MPPETLGPKWPGSHKQLPGKPIFVFTSNIEPSRENQRLLYSCKWFLTSGQPTTNLPSSAVSNGDISEDIACYLCTAFSLPCLPARLLETRWRLADLLQQALNQQSVSLSLCLHSFAHLLFCEASTIGISQDLVLWLPYHFFPQAGSHQVLQLWASMRAWCHTDVSRQLTQLSTPGLGPRKEFQMSQTQSSHFLVWTLLDLVLYSTHSL